MKKPHNKFIPNIDSAGIDGYSRSLNSKSGMISRRGGSATKFADFISLTEYYLNLEKDYEPRIDDE